MYNNGIIYNKYNKGAIIFMSVKFISVIVSIVTVFLSIGLPFNKTEAPDDNSGFVPVIRFAAMSDTHIQFLADKKIGRIQKALSLAYSDARKDENYNQLDAAIFAGDLTDNGRRDQFIAFQSALDSALKDETQPLAVVAKSHDGNTLDKESLSYYKKLTGLDTDFHYIIKGFHFIGLSASATKGDHYSEYQRVWLKEQLAQAAADGPQKPIFLVHHEHMMDTVYGSSEFDGWGMSYFKDIISQYPQIIDFSGHSHYPLNDPRSIWQGEFTAVGTGAIYYAELTVDSDRTVHPEGNRKIAQMWITEVDSSNTVRLRGFDALSGSLLCEYYLNDIADASKRQYTPALQEKRAGAPAFESGAALKIKKSFGKYKVTVPAAKSTDDYKVFLYRIFVYDKDGNEVHTEYIVNNYWVNDDFDSVTFKIKAEKGFTIKVTAENSYGMPSQALTSEL